MKDALTQAKKLLCKNTFYVTRPAIAHESIHVPVNNLSYSSNQFIHRHDLDPVRMRRCTRQDGFHNSFR